MIIDNQEGFDISKDKLVWKKIIYINSSNFKVNYNDNNNSFHIVQYYQSLTKDYYIFEYINADNNGRNLSNYNNYYYAALAEILNPKDDACFYEKINGKEKYNLVTIGYFLNKAKNK